MIKGFRLNAASKETLLKHIERIDLTSFDYSVDVQPWKSKRSLDQNARYWKLITAFGDYVGYEADEMHQLMAYKFLRHEKKGRTFVRSTTKLNTAEMADYQDRIERLAAQQGFVFEE